MSTTNPGFGIYQLLHYFFWGVFYEVEGLNLDQDMHKKFQHMYVIVYFRKICGSLISKKKKLTKNCQIFISELVVEMWWTKSYPITQFLLIVTILNSHLGFGICGEQLNGSWILGQDSQDFYLVCYLLSLITTLLNQDVLNRKP